MKKFTAFFCFTLICLSFSFNFAQSRRPAVPDSSGKANKREPKPAESPTATPTPTVEEIESANDGEPIVEDSGTIKIDTELVTIPFKVLDRKGRFIGGLKRENFQVSEDKIDQEIDYFTNEEQPFTVALVLDMSYSTTFKIAEIQSAAMAFITQLRPDDKVTVVSFDGEVHVLCSPTNDRQVLQRAIRSTKVASGTSLYEAVDLVINQMLNRVNGRKAIVLFTDGVDTTSRKAHDLDNLRDALELDTLIFPIQYDTFAQVQSMNNSGTVIVPPTTTPNPIPTQNKSPFPFPLPTTGVGTASGQGSTAEDYRRADEYLNELANRTSGRLYKADTTANLAQAFSNIADELRQYYSLGYYPKDSAKIGTKRKIKVRVNQENLVVRAREGYMVRKK